MRSQTPMWSLQALNREQLICKRGNPDFRLPCEIETVKVEKAGQAGIEVPDQYLFRRNLRTREGEGVRTKPPGINYCKADCDRVRHRIVRGGDRLALCSRQDYGMPID